MLVLTFWLRIEYSIVIILLAFERRVESRRRRRGDLIIIFVLTLMGRQYDEELGLATCKTLASKLEGDPAT